MSLKDSVEEEFQSQTSFGVEAKVRNATDRERWVRLFGTKTNRDSEDPKWVIGVQDINLEVMNRMRLNEVSRLESLGELCGGLAHDFNNLLTVIGIYSEMIEDDELRKKIENAQNQAIELTSNLRAFAGQRNTEKKLNDLGEFLSSIRNVINRLVPVNIKLVWQIQNRCFVRVDPAEMQQVLINLVTNAIHAMPHDGQLCISVRIRDGKAEGLGEKVWVDLVVADSGHGMCEETRRRAMEPFFTTKPRGEGTGIGLSTVHGLVNSVEGRVEIESECGQGTRVCVSLPYESPHRDPGEESRSDSHFSLVAESDLDGKVILVEDRESLRLAMTTMLQSAGFHVQEYSTGEDALEAIENDEGFDVLISDVVLPGISGFELKDRVVSLYPEAKFVLMSGYQQNELEGNIDGANCRFLGKPFRMKSLIECVQSFDEIELSQHSL